MMNPFTLDPRLQNDCFVLGKMNVCHLLLMNNALFPWFILVPETKAVELCDLGREFRILVHEETDRTARFVKDHFPVDKINVAAIGNVVRQLHIHVIGRRTDDPCWPGVVWGSGMARPYTDDKRDALIRLVRTCFPSPLSEP